METGKYAFEGTTTPFDLWPAPQGVPAPRPDGWPLAVILHGFGANSASLRGHAERLAGLGFVVLAPNMSSLLGGARARQRNVGMVAAQVRELASTASPDGGRVLRAGGAVDRARVLLVGHSAGGALILEVASALAAAGQCAAAVVLLDAVAWPRTWEVAKSFDADRTLVVSVRSTANAWNMNGVFRQVLAASFAPGHAGVLDILICGSKHGDAMLPRVRGLAAYWPGLVGPPRGTEIYADLITAVARDVHSADPPPPTVAACPTTVQTVRALLDAKEIEGVLVPC